MPALVNISVGSFFTTIGADGKMTCPFEWKKSRKACRISALVIIFANVLGLIFAVYRAIFVNPVKAGQR